jgi:predicted HicB family RNase H-like nuclease
MHKIFILENQRALVTDDPDTGMLRGELLDLNGGADFYADDMASLAAEGAQAKREPIDPRSLYGS